ncbi:Phage late control protein D (plasmid) [Deinococcus geothermalis DSM 11300]|uniref:Phage late control protein D n=1 Tax=Deinococcus geothermalis (strain DSM 11300 / CIP 105573 / AG-3a) TaxID=319795 RepID=A8ZRG7_DEIGD|nr:hypothetical protein [Deinococcus geothermalis]ABW35076.1 Phage late control protein D [Deinococcus geothermalis DSM 11300]
MSLYHTHAWVSVTSAASGIPSSAGPLDLLSLTDSASLGGAQSLTFTIAGRARNGQPWRELISVGDLVSVGAQRHEEGQSVSVTLAEDAVVQDVQVGEQMAQGQYTLTTSVTAEGLQGMLQADAVAWWMYYGTEIGALRARGELLPDDTSGDLAKVLANYLNKVALHRANWNRDGVGLKERLGYHLKALKPNVPILKNLSLAEGSHWEIMAQHAELNLHEFFVAQRRRGDTFKGGFVHHPTHTARPLVSTDAPGEGDGSHPYIILRPKPFPYADRNGQPVMAEWNALPLHDLTGSRATTGQHAFGRSLGGVRNFFMIYPGYDAMNDMLAFTTGLAVLNRASIERYGYRPVKFGTNLVLNVGSEDTMLDLARDLTWRMAAQMNRTDEMAQGSITVPLAPEIQPGDRVRFRLVHTDSTDGGVFQGYVTGRTHSYQKGQGGTTALQLERVLPDSVYRDPAWFVQGLARVDLDWQNPRHGY